jgi:beta-N-acetylhexosaminidase
MASTTTLREAAGSLLVVGLSGTELTALERAWLKLIRPGGVILFRRNIVDVDQTRALLNEATGLASRHSVRCVDVEGGTVNRLRDALAPIASAQAVAAAARNAKRPALSRKHGELIARAVRAFGFNTTLAPVVDLTLPEATDVLGTRTTGATASDVIGYAREFLAGLSAQQIAGCGKHFPGLGGAAGDTHFVTPEIERSRQQLWEEDTVPYRQLHRQMPMIMMNHAAYPKTQSKKDPASASWFWIGETLRRRIGYKGLILSDDLEMGGILKFLPVEEAAVAAIRAGSDLLEICHSAELILRSYEALISEAERSAAFRKLLLTTARDSGRKRARLYTRGIPKPPTARSLEKLRSEILAFNQQVAGMASAIVEVAPRAAAPAEAS